MTSPAPRVPPEDDLGRRVREAWVKWAKEQPDPKPSWLIEWPDLEASQREVDIRIGKALADFAAERCAQAILAHMEAHGPKDRGSNWRRHLSTAARVAAGAFMTREDMLAGAAEAIRRGDFIVCPSLQDHQEHP